VSAGNDVAVLGVGMHPWGKWGRNFVSYGVHAARAALQDSAVAWEDVDLIVGGETVRNGYGGYVAGATFAQALGWNGARVATSYAACATGAQALDTARARILAGLSEVALVVGADTTPKGFLAPNAGERWDDPDWLRFRLLGMTNPGYFALYARRRMDLYGATQADFAEVKVKNARHGLNNPNARYRKEVSADDVLNSAVVSDPLHLLDICATSDGAAAVVLTSMDYARRHGLAQPVRVRAVSTVTPRFPNTVIDMPLLSTDPAGHAGPEAVTLGSSSERSERSDETLGSSSERSERTDETFKQSIGAAAYEEAGIGPDEVSLAEVYDLSTALELDWIEDLALCKQGEAEHLLRAGDTTIGGRIPVNPSGGLACFGEAVPAQALAQVCEVTWQLRGQASGRQVEDAKVGITANQGLFGHGSSVLLSV
jgi:acetyl-CoA acetyltransferase